MDRDGARRVSDVMPPPPGEEVSFEARYREAWSPVVRYLARRGGRAGAEDAAAEVFVIAWRRHVDTGDVPSLPWLIGTARNVARNRARGERRRTHTAERAAVAVARASTDGRWDPQVALLGRELLDVLARELDDLDAEIVLLTAWEGLTAPQVAEVVGLGDAAVRQRLVRARRRLRAALATPTPEPRDV